MLSLVMNMRTIRFQMTWTRRQIKQLTVVILWELLLIMMFLVCSVKRLIIPLVIKSIGSSGVISSFVSFAFLLLGVVVVVVSGLEVVFVIALGENIGLVILISMSSLPLILRPLLLNIFLLISTHSLERLLFLLPFIWSNNIRRSSFLASMCMLVVGLVWLKCVIKELVVPMVSGISPSLRIVLGIVFLVSASHWLIHRSVHKVIVLWLELLVSLSYGMSWVFLFVFRS